MSDQLQVSEAVEEFSTQDADEDYIYKLARRAGDGDEAALEELLTSRDFMRITHVISSKCVGNYRSASYEDARDLQQTLSIKVWQKLRGHAAFNNRAHFVSWLFTIARTSEIDRKRRTRREPDIQSFTTAQEVPTSEIQTIRVGLDESISELDFRSRIVLGRWAARVSAEEIAEELGVSVPTVYSTIEKIQKSLAARIEHPDPSVDWDALLRRIVESQDEETIFDESLAEIEKIRTRMQHLQSDIDRQKTTTQSLIASLGLV